MQVASCQLRLAASAALALAASGCGTRIGRGATALPPCAEGAVAAVDTTGWQPAPGYPGAGYRITLPPGFAPGNVILCYHGGALWDDTTANAVSRHRVVGYCNEGEGFLGDVPDSVQRRTAPMPLPEQHNACLLSFPVLGQQAALWRWNYRTYDGRTLYVWRAWPLEFWEDFQFYARSESPADEALFLRALRTWQRERRVGPPRLRPN